METVIVNNVEMVKLSIRDVFQKVDEMFEKFKEMEIKEGACTFAAQTLNMIEHFSAKPIQQI